MTQTPIVHDFKELGTLQLESGKTTNPEEGGTIIESYWMRVNFEALVTGVTYCADIDDDQIRKYCTILNADPDLLNDFLVVKPNINILPQAVMTEFTLRLGSKTYGFIVHIPKFIPNGSTAEVVELHQKNNVLVRRIKTLEECIKMFGERIKILEEHNEQQKKNIVMFADFCMPQIFDDCHAGADGYMQRSIEIAGENPLYFDRMIGYIKTVTSKIGTRLLEMLKTEKLPKLKDCLINKRKEIYLSLIGNNATNINYVDRILQFCHLGIEIDNDIVFEGQVIIKNWRTDWKTIMIESVGTCVGRLDLKGLDMFSDPPKIKPVLIEDSKSNYETAHFTMIEYFDYQVTSYIPFSCYNQKHIPEYQIFIKSPEFLQKCDEVRKSLIKLNKK